MKQRWKHVYKAYSKLLSYDSFFNAPYYIHKKHETFERHKSAISKRRKKLKKTP